MEDQDLLNSSMPSSLLSHSHPHSHPSSQHQHQQLQHHQHQHQHQQHHQQQQHQQHPHQHQHHQHSQYIFDDNINNININSLSNLSSNNLTDLGLNTSLSTFAPSLSLTSSASAPVLPSSTLPSSSLSLSLPHAVSEHGRYDYDYYQSQSQSHSLTPTPSTTTTARRASTQLQSNRNKRTKLSTEERAKVLEIRRQRACLRCKMLKIQCSRDNPCKPCLSSAVRGYERKVLSFCYCVRTRFADVDIFSSGSNGGHTPNINNSPKTFTFGARTEVPASIRRLMDQIEPPTLPVMEENVFEDTLLRWLTSASEEFSPTSGSIVAMLYTIIGQSESLKKAIDPHLPSDFQTFIFTTSLVHTGWKGSVSHRDLCIAGHVCGSRIVQRLDRILTPQFLAKCDKDTHRALLLLIFGLILGVSYSTRLTTSPSFPHDLLGLEMRHSPTLWLALKEHLAQMLAHHLIFLGSTLGIKLDTASEKTIIETAVNRWNKPERSLWAGKGSMERSAAVERTNEIALISRVFGLRGMEDFSTLQDLSGPPTSQTPRTVTASDGTPSQTHPSMPSAHPSTSAPMASTSASSLPIVAVTYPDLTDLQSMPPMTSNDDDEQFYQSHEHFHQRDQREDYPLHDNLDNNPESFYAMTDDDITGLLSPVTNLPERENVDNTDNDNENEEGDKDGQSEREEGDSEAGDSDNSNANTSREIAKTSTAATTSNAPPPPSRNAMGNDGMANNTRKRRSVWIVRPYSDNEAQEPVNVYARFRVHQGQNLGLFV